MSRFNLFLLIFIPSVFLFSGCGASKENKQKLNNFIKKYGKAKVYVCEQGFLVERYANITNMSYYEYSHLIRDDNDVPIRCKGVNTKEFVGVPTDADTVSLGGE